MSTRGGRVKGNRMKASLHRMGKYHDEDVGEGGKCHTGGLRRSVWEAALLSHGVSAIGGGGLWTFGFTMPYGRWSLGRGRATKSPGNPQKRSEECFVKGILLK